MEEVPVLSNVQTPLQSRKMKNQAKTLQTKEEDRFSETNPNKMELNNVPDRKLSQKNVHQGQENINAGTDRQQYNNSRIF